MCATAWSPLDAKMSISANDSMDSSSTQGESGMDVGHGVKEVRLSYSFNGVSCMCNDYCMHACMQSFKVDYEDCTFGLLLAKGQYKPKSNFTMELMTYVEAGSNSGFFANVTRRSDRLKK